MNTHVDDFLSIFPGFAQVVLLNLINVFIPVTSMVVKFFMHEGERYEILSVLSMRIIINVKR